jgi:hypothetical protein
MKGARKSRPGCFILNLMGIIIDFILFIRVLIYFVNLLKVLLCVIASNVYKVSEAVCLFPFVEGTTHSQATHLR